MNDEIRAAMDRHPAGKGRPDRQVAAVVFGDGSRVQPTQMGVRAIERLVRKGWSLADATVHITRGPRIVREGES